MPDTLPPSKKRWFFLITLLVPILIIAFAELALRVFDYGPNLSLFIVDKSGGVDYYVMNPDVKGRYFAHVDFSPNTSTDCFRVQKAPGTLRIFCLGGSTTAGFPYSFVGAFSTFLRDRLHAMIPDRPVEVINLGMTATNSYTVLDIARELPDYDPDLVIIYDGHNEFYGALGAASRETAGPTGWITRLYLRAVRFKTFLLVRQVYGLVTGMMGGGKNGPSGTMMEVLARDRYVPYRSPLYARALEIFRNNVGETVSILEAHHIPVILSTQVSNVRTLPPFVSSQASTLPVEMRLTLDREINDGITAQLDGSTQEAITHFQKALAIDSLRAETHFHLGQCYEAAGEFSQARRAYISARDDDELRFRASSDFNDMLRAQAHPPSVIVADIEREFMALCPDSLVDTTLILEHLHPNARGSFVMGKVYAGALMRSGISLPSPEWSKRDTVSETRLWEERPLTGVDESCARRRIQILTAGWPFRDHHGEVPDPARDDTLAWIVEAMVRGATTWEQGHVEAAEFFERKGHLSDAAREYRTIINQIPVNVSPYVRLGKLLVELGNAPEAAKIFRVSLGIERTFFATRALGIMELNASRPEGAVPLLSQALALSRTEDRADVWYLLALAYFRAGQHDLARRELGNLLHEFPDAQQAAGLFKRLQR
jgi:tetratricopeptide (TPR) repeat protein